MAGVVQERYCRENNSILNHLKEQGSCRLNEDGRCDSPGHNAKYLTYSFMDQITNKIAAMTITQVTEAKNTNNMEKVGFIKELKFLRTNGVTVDQITTDRRSQIRKHMRKNDKDTIHQFDIWHFCKSIKKNLAAVAKKLCQALNGWIKSIISHLWWTVSTCNGDETLVREKWCSILFHIQNKHKWSSCSKFHKCVHPRITKSKTRKKLWLNPTSDTFNCPGQTCLRRFELPNQVFSHWNPTDFSCVKWIPKSQHFSHLGMVTRSQLAVMDFNSGSDLPQAKTKGGQGKYNLGYSKITKRWSSKPIKIKQDKTYYFQMINRTAEVIKNKIQVLLPKLPENLPKNIAPTERLNKKLVIETQKSKFSKRSYTNEI